MSEMLIHPGVVERQLSLFAWEAEALARGELKRLLRPYGQSETLDRIIAYQYGSVQLILKKPWRTHLARVGGEGDGTSEPLTLEQVQDAGLPDEQAFLKWCMTFGVEGWCWLATFEDEEVE